MDGMGMLIQSVIKALKLDPKQIEEMIARVPVLINSLDTRVAEMDARAARLEAQLTRVESAIGQLLELQKVVTDGR